MKNGIYELKESLKAHNVTNLVNQQNNYYQRETTQWPKKITRAAFARAAALGGSTLEIQFTNLSGRGKINVRHFFSGKFIQGDPVNKIIERNIPGSFMHFKLPVIYLRQFLLHDLYYVLCEDENGKFLILYFDQDQAQRSAAKTNSSGAKIP